MYSMIFPSRTQMTSAFLDSAVCPVDRRKTHIAEHHITVVLDDRLVCDE